MSKSSEESEGGSYGSEAGDSSDNEAYHAGDGAEIEVDRANVLNYESDDSEMDGGDDSDFDANLEKQREDLVMNDTWGSRKRNFYGRDKKHDVYNFCIHWLFRTLLRVKMTRMRDRKRCGFRK